MTFENAHVHQKGSYLKKIKVYSKRNFGRKKELNFDAIFWI
jgi:hypothetical protein